MITDDQPFTVDLLKQQGKITFSISDSSRKMILPDQKDCLFVYQADIKDVEFQLSHCSSIGIASFIVVQYLLPPVCRTISSYENQLWRIPVSLHEPVYVTTVPGVLLHLKESSYGNFIIF